MRIAVLGAGTAGCMAAAHITKELPGAELLHVFDSRIPRIGVGEGTTPNIPMWLHDVTGLDFDGLRDRVRITRKNGTTFEGWGKGTPPFLNRFQRTSVGRPSTRASPPSAARARARRSPSRTGTRSPALT
jgi:tryptophan halogenase